MTKPFDPTKPPKPKKEARPVGRPSNYTKDIADAVCAKLAEGQSLRKICSQDGMPAIISIYRWMREHEEFSAQYARAREDQAEGYADEITEIADLSDDPAKARVQIDARKWIAAKLKPKKYGEKIVQEHVGADGAPILWGIPPKNTK